MVNSRSLYIDGDNWSMIFYYSDNSQKAYKGTAKDADRLRGYVFNTIIVSEKVANKEFYTYMTNAQRLNYQVIPRDKETQRNNVCECGSEKLGYSTHSIWCPKHG